MKSSLQSEALLVGTIPTVRAILAAVCQATGMGFAAVARVTEKHWIACQTHDLVNFGLTSGGELPIESTLCNELRASGQAIIIDDVSKDPVYAQHHTPQIYGLQSYISVPINLTDGTFFGTLCAIDARPARLKGTSIPEMFRLFAQLIAGHIEDQRLLLQAQSSLSESRVTSDLREQFIGVLGHDLQNPLTSIQAGARLLKRETLTPRAQTILDHMEQTAGRMSKLVGHMLDLARGRLAGGIHIDPVADVPLSETLDQILMEARTSHPNRQIDVHYVINQPVQADRGRIAQLFSNLLGNAIAYGASNHPIRVEAKIETDHFELSVANAGTPIAPEIFHRLFQPFQRGSQDGLGLGLGLYIADQIARAHSGTLTASSNEQETKFTFRMPVRHR